MVYRKCPCCDAKFNVNDAKCWNCQISIIGMPGIREEFPSICQAELQKLRADSPRPPPSTYGTSLSVPASTSVSLDANFNLSQSSFEEETRIIKSCAQGRVMAQRPRVLENNEKKRQRGSTSTLYSLPVLPSNCMRANIRPLVPHHLCLSQSVLSP